MSEIRLERGKYYVAEVSFRQGNPVHMAIAYGQLTSGVVLWCSGYEEQIWADVSKLSWFKIVTALPQMDWRPSRHMPPSKKGRRSERLEITHEQKPESAEFRTREVHRQHIAQTWQGEGMSKSLADAWADSELSEAEARGAAEQRRKDAEGAEPVKWQRDNPGNGWIDTPVEDLPFYKERGFPIRPLYTHPANVAALEARVRGLEGEKERSSRTIEMLRRHVETLRTEARQRSAMARLARERANCEGEAARMYRRALSEIVGRTDPRSYSHNRASAALAAAIREGGTP